MEIRRVLISTTGTTRHISMRTVGSGNYSVAPVKKSCSELGKEMLVLFGENSKTTAVRKELTAPFSATSQPTLVVNSYAKRMRLLIESGLVKGIIPTSKRKGSGQLTLDVVLRQPGGSDAESQK